MSRTRLTIEPSIVGRLGDATAGRPVLLASRESLGNRIFAANSDYLAVVLGSIAAVR